MRLFPLPDSVVLVPAGCVDSKASRVSGAEGSSVGIADMSASTCSSVHSSVSFCFAAGRMSSVDIRYEQAIVPDRPFPAVKFCDHREPQVKIVKRTFAVEHGDPIFIATKVRVYLPRNEREDGQWRCAAFDFRAWSGIGPTTVLTGDLGTGTCSPDPQTQRTGTSSLPQDKS